MWHQLFSTGKSKTSNKELSPYHAFTWQFLFLAFHSGWNHDAWRYLATSPSLLEVVPNLVGKQCNTQAKECPYNVLPFQFIKKGAQVIVRDEM